MKPPRTLLFVPASRPAFVDKAHLRGADVVILDLEDGVAPAEKELARGLVGDHVRRLVGLGQRTWVRVRADQALGGDLAAIAGAGAEAVLLPKVEASGEIAAALSGLDVDTVLVPTIETAAGLLAAPSLARSDARIAGLAFGSEDFATDLGIAPEPTGLAFPAQQVVIAARAAGLPAFGLPGSLAEIDDLDALAEVADLGARIGFQGALCVHPAQVPVLSRAFGPTAEAVAWAQAVVEAAGEGGAVMLNGAMIDRPIVERARAILARSD